MCEKSPILQMLSYLLLQGLGASDPYPELFCMDEWQTWPSLMLLTKSARFFPLSTLLLRYRHPFITRMIITLTCRFITTDQPQGWRITM